MEDLEEICYMEDDTLQSNCTTCKSSPASPTSPEIEIKGTIDSKHKVIVRDYAYPLSFPSSTPPPCLRPIPEMFDQHEGLAEVDYRWSQSVRMHPVPGKILSRLLDMGWITEEEVRARASPMDLEELRKHDAWLPKYPWKPLGSKTIPKDEDRKDLMLARAPYFQYRDATRAKAELKEMSSKNSDNLHTGKRRVKKDNETYSGANSKKRRTLPMPPQLKQYPAPRHAYDPNIYPEVAFPTESPASSNPPSRRPLVRQSTYIFSFDDDKTKRENNN